MEELEYYLSDNIRENSSQHIVHADKINDTKQQQVKDEQHQFIAIEQHIVKRVAVICNH